MSAGRWATGAGAVVVLVAAGAWAMRPGGDVDAGLWAQVRPVIEARLVHDSQGDGYGEDEPALRARWFCRAEALRLEENGDRVRAGVNTLCVEYGVRDRALVACGGAQYPRVMLLRRDAGGGYRVVSSEEAPDGAGHAQWRKTHFGTFADAALNTPQSATPLESAARRHFGLPADSPVGDC
ncbi:hypothetical protein ACYF6T_10675 [Streptomyces sp. 7R007]